MSVIVLMFLSNLHLPVPTDRVCPSEDYGLADGFDIFGHIVHAWDLVHVSLGHGVLFAIVDAKSERAAFLGANTIGATNSV